MSDDRWCRFTDISVLNWRKEHEIGRNQWRHHTSAPGDAIWVPESIGGSPGNRWNPYVRQIYSKYSILSSSQSVVIRTTEQFSSHSNASSSIDHRYFFRLGESDSFIPLPRKSSLKAYLSTLQILDPSNVIYRQSTRPKVHGFRDVEVQSVLYQMRLAIDQWE